MNRPLMAIALEIRECSARHGFTRPGVDNISEKLMLVTDELSEAHEEVRDGRFEVYYSTECGYGEGRNRGDSKPEGFPVEIADAIIRLLDICAGFSIDIDAVIQQKMQFNESRPPLHGRKF